MENRWRLPQDGQRGLPARTTARTRLSGMDNLMCSTTSTHGRTQFTLVSTFNFPMSVQTQYEGAEQWWSVEGLCGCKAPKRNRKFSPKFRKSDGWVTIEIDRIQISGGACEIGIVSSASASQWLNVDDIKLEQK